MSGALSQVLSSPGTWLLAFTYFFIYVVRAPRGLPQRAALAPRAVARRRTPRLAPRAASLARTATATATTAAIAAATGAPGRHLLGGLLPAGG
jgi:hypothetical protein